jgi:hypothetical protein
MLGRVRHEKYGLGTVLSERTSESRLPLVVVVFDDSPEAERLILPAFLVPSETQLPAAAKTIVKKKRAAPKPKPEKIKDTLLVDLPDAYLPDDSEVHLESVDE